LATAESPQFVATHLNSSYDEKAISGIIVAHINDAQISAASGLAQGFASAIATSAIFQCILHYVFHFVLFDAVVVNVELISIWINVKAKMHIFLPVQTDE
jgi:hypothetical protein